MLKKFEKKTKNFRHSTTLKGKQYNQSRGNPASSGWMKIDQTARQSREKCSALA